MSWSAIAGSVCVRRDRGKVLNDLLRALCLSCARLTPLMRSMLDKGQQRNPCYAYVMSILWFSLSSPILVHARSAIANMCGGFSSRRFPRYWCTMASEYSGKF